MLEKHVVTLVSFRGPVARNIIWNFNIAIRMPNVALGAVESVYAIIFHFIWICFVLFYWKFISFPSGCIRRGFKHFIHISYFPCTIGSSESIIMYCVCELRRETGESCQILGCTNILSGPPTAFCCRFKDALVSNLSALSANLSCALY